MSAPLILPEGNDRSWTRQFYRTINKVFRRMWYEQRCDEKLEAAWRSAMISGIGAYKLEVLK